MTCLLESYFDSLRSHKGIFDLTLQDDRFEHNRGAVPTFQSPTKRTSPRSSNSSSPSNHGPPSCPLRTRSDEELLGGLQLALMKFSSSGDAAAIAAVAPNYSCVQMHMQPRKERTTADTANFYKRVVRSKGGRGLGPIPSASTMRSCQTNNRILCAAAGAPSSLPPISQNSPASARGALFGASVTSDRQRSSASSSAASHIEERTTIMNEYTTIKLRNLATLSKAADISKEDGIITSPSYQRRKRRDTRWMTSSSMNHNPISVGN